MAKELEYDFCEKHSMVALKDVNSWNPVPNIYREYKLGRNYNRATDEVFILHEKRCPKCK